MANDYISLHTGLEIDNSIDRKVVDLDEVPKINKNDNLNNYTSPGVFGISSNVIATSLYDNGNCPSKNAGRLIVVSAIGNSISSSGNTVYLRQIYETYHGVVYQREASSNTGIANLEWANWELIYGVNSVIESGVKGGWRYRKWSNGQEEYWNTISVTPTSSTPTTSGSGYYSNDILPGLWPHGLLISSGITVTATADSSCWCSIKEIEESTNSPGYSYRAKLRLLRLSEISTTSPVTICIHVLGNWK